MRKPTSNELKKFVGKDYILVVDPSANFRDSMKRFLINMGVTNVKLVANAADAKREMITAKFALIISEWVLPEQNGLQLCRAIRNKRGYDQTPFILITAENLKSDVILACEAGVDGYLLKPFAYTDFSSQIIEIIKKKQSPNHLNQMLMEGESKLAEKKLDQAESFFRRALEEKQSSARAYCGLGQIELLKENIKSAAKYLEYAILANPDYIDAYNYLLDTYELLGNTDKSVKLAERAHAISPDNPRYTLILAKGYFEIGNMDDSETFFKKTLLLSPKLGDAYKGLGSVYFESEQFDKAIKTYKKALDLEPGDIAILNSLGMSYVRKGLLVQGIDHYRLALVVDAFDYRVLFNLGYAYEKLGDEKQAMDYYTKTLSSNPDHEKAKRRLQTLKKAG